MSHVATEALKVLVDATERLVTAEHDDLNSDEYDDTGMHSDEWMAASDAHKHALTQAKRVLDVLGVK